MDLRRLEYFCVIAETGSMRRAAELLHLSPAALSKAMKLLESEVGQKLIVPSGRGILISDEGKRLKIRAQPLLREIQSFKKGVGAEKDPSSLRLGSFEVFTTYFLGVLVKTELSDVQLEIHEFAPGGLELAVAQGQVDLGLTYLPIPTPDLDFLKVGQVEMGLFSRRGSFEEDEPLEKIPFAVPVIPIHGSPTKVQGLDGWPDDRIPRNMRYRVTLMESALELCRQGMACAYLPQFIVQLHNKQVKENYQLLPRHLPKTIKSTSQAVYLIKRKSDTETAVVRRIARAVRNHTEGGS